MGEIFGAGISAGATLISAILIVVVLIVAFAIRKKIQPKENDNEFLFWGRKQGEIEDDPGEGQNDPGIEAEETEEDDSEEYEEDEDDENN